MRHCPLDAGLRGVRDEILHKLCCAFPDLRQGWVESKAYGGPLSGLKLARVRIIWAAGPEA